MKTRFRVIIQALANGIKRLTFKPSNIEKDIADELPGAINFFNENLYEFSDDLTECSGHFEELYKTLPKDVPFFYRVQKYYTRDDGFIDSFCTPIGVGTNEVEALADYKIDRDGKWQMSKIRPNLAVEKGHFVKAYFDGDDLVFEKTNADYEFTVRSANILKREKIRKFTLNLPLDEGAIPKNLVLSKFWTQVSKNNKFELERKGALEEMEKLNREFQDAEKKFYEGVQIYRDYKTRLRSMNTSSELIGFILKGASIAINLTTKDQYSSQIKAQTDIFQNLEKEIASLRKKLEEDRKKANSKATYIFNYYRQLSVPVDDKIEMIEYDYELP